MIQFPLAAILFYVFQHQICVSLFSVKVCGENNPQTNTWYQSQHWQWTLNTWGFVVWGNDSWECEWSDTSVPLLDPDRNQTVSFTNKSSILILSQKWAKGLWQQMICWAKVVVSCLCCCWGTWWRWFVSAWEFSLLSCSWGIYHSCIIHKGGLGRAVWSAGAAASFVCATVKQIQIGSPVCNSKYRRELPWTWTSC